MRCQEISHHPISLSGSGVELIPLCRDLYLQVDIDWKPRPYLNVVSNDTLVKLYEKNSANFGVEFERDDAILRQVCNFSF